MRDEMKSGLRYVRADATLVALTLLGFGPRSWACRC